MAVREENVSPGDVMAFISWVKVDMVTRGVRGYGTVVSVTDVDTGSTYQIKGTELVEQGESSDIITDTQKSTKTKVAEILVTAHNKPFTVEFVTVKGETRTMRARLVKPEPLLGRSLVQELCGKDGAVATKQVDHRTIKWLILDGIKYVVSSK